VVVCRQGPPTPCMEEAHVSCAWLKGSMRLDDVECSVIDARKYEAYYESHIKV